MNPADLPQPEIYFDLKRKRYHALLDDRLVMNLSESERDANVKAYNQGRHYVTPTARWHETPNKDGEEGYTAYLDKQFKVLYDDDRKKARITSGPELVSADIDFADWLMPILERRGFKPQWVTSPAYGMGKGIAFSGFIVFCAVCVLMAPQLERAGFIGKITGGILVVLGPIGVVIAAVVLIALALWRSMDFKVRHKKIFVIKKPD